MTAFLHFLLRAPSAILTVMEDPGLGPKGDPRGSLPPPQVLDALRVNPQIPERDFWRRNADGRIQWDLEAANRAVTTRLRPGSTGPSGRAASATASVEDQAPPRPPVPGDLPSEDEEDEEDDMGSDTNAEEPLTENQDVRPVFTGTSTWYSLLSPEDQRR